MKDFDINVQITATVLFLRPPKDRNEEMLQAQARRQVQLRAEAFERELRSILLSDIGTME